MNETRLFAFVQLDLAGPLGPSDGRYLLRAGAGGDPEAVVVLRTHGRTPRPPGRLARLFRRRAPRERGAGPPEAAAVRATIIRAHPLPDWDSARRRLAELRRDRSGLAGEVEWAVGVLNRLLRAHRAAAADPAVREVSAARALAVRSGYGTGDEVAAGRFSDALQVPPPPPPRRREALVPEDRLAAILRGHEPDLASVELVMRARLDVDAGRPREAALQARIALEALLAELGAAELGEALPALEADRGPVGEAANGALGGDPPPPSSEAVARAVERMEAALRRQRARRREGGSPGGLPPQAAERAEPEPRQPRS